jgi:hypothetical protein
MRSSGDTLEAVGVPLAQFMELTRIPIVIVYGDNIPDRPMAVPSQDQWRTRLAMARLWADAVNRRGGDVGLGTGTSAEGWVADAIGFWVGSMRRGN